MRLLIATGATGILVALAILFGAWDRIHSTLTRPMDSAGPQRIIEIPVGSKTVDVLDALQAAEVVRPGRWLRLYAERLRYSDEWVAGEYALSAKMSAYEQLQRIARGEVIQHPVTLPDGIRLKEVARRLAEAGLGDADQLLAQAQNPGLAQALGLESSSIEGYILPDAYRLAKPVDDEGSRVWETLVKLRNAAIEKAKLAPPEGWTHHDWVRLASLVEKAPVRPDQRRIYARILMNRYAAGLPLGRNLPSRTSPSGEGMWTGEHPGLPPRPVCNPGLDALQAAARPASTRARYLVRRNDGTHIFCMDKRCYFSAVRRGQDVRLIELDEAMP